MMKKLLQAPLIYFFIMLYLAVGVLGTEGDYFAPFVDPGTSVHTCKHVNYVQNDAEIDDVHSHGGISGNSHDPAAKKISFAVAGLPHPFFLHVPSFTTTIVTRQHLAYLSDPRINLLASRAPPA